MIGKIMSEAAHSIIGMFSAKPLGMENKVSHSDFGSFLRSPEEQPQFGGGAEAIERFDDENLGVAEADAVAAHWETNNILPFINQSFGGKIIGQEIVSQEVRKDGSTVDTDHSFLPSQAKAILGDGPQINMAPGLAGQDVADRQLAGHKILGAQSAEVTVGKELRNLQAQKIEGIQLGTQIDEKSVSSEIFPSSEKGLLKLQGQQGAMRSEIAQQATLIAKTEKSIEPQGSDLQFSDRLNQHEPGKQASAVLSLVADSAEQRDALSRTNQLGVRISPSDAAPAAPTDLKVSVVGDTESVEPVKLETQPANKGLDKLVEQQPVTNSSAQLAVRETLQKPVPFDMSSPQIAERLATEIADISVSGGPKKFELNPRNLGRMEITFTTRDGAEIIEIQTEHRAAKDMIVQHSQLLQDILKSQGRDDLTLRVDVKENMPASARSDGGQLGQQENRDAREQARPTPRRPVASSFDNSADDDPASDNSRYA
ncbi:flagellar hook-length control protein FliK [Parasphingorhabdus flavimaris]|uniref:flagellar hook-length control protein FliK n=1 Tax=Parasphingorhabdus flavimaris TaxID=266812 RepID=UPI0030030B21